MNLETILWIATGIVISEIIFIVWILVRNNDSYWSIPWGVCKVVSFVIGGLVTAFHWVLVHCGGTECNTNNYIYLLYELGILGILGVLVLINWLVVKKIKKVKGKK